MTPPASTAPDCRRCGRPVADNAYTCTACAETLRRALGDVAAVTTELNRTMHEQVNRNKGGRVEVVPVPLPPGQTLGWPTAPWERPRGHRRDLATDLAATMARQSRGGSGAGKLHPGSKNDTSPLPYDPRPADAGRHLRSTLVSWALLVLEERGGQAPADDVRAIAAWLLWHVEWLRHQEFAGQVIDQVDDAVRGVVRAIDRAEPRWYAGPCGNVVEGVECGTDLYSRPDAAVVACPSCGAEYDVRARRKWLIDAARDTLAHAELIGRAAQILGVDVTPSAVRGYAFRKRIVEHGTDLQGRPLYRVGDVLDVAASIAAERSKKGRAS